MPHATRWPVTRTTWRLVRSLAMGAALSGAVLLAQGSAVTRETVPGISNLARVETTVACAGATTPEAMAAIKRMGFAAVINLRLATENGADVDAETTSAKAAGLRYVHLPFSATDPDPAVVDRFLAAIVEPANQPALIHCASGVRAAMMWMIKRVQIDRWDVEKAADEAAALGLTSPRFKQFALDYLQAHPR